MGTPDVDSTDNAVNFIGRYTGPGYIIGTYTMPFEHGLPDKNPVFHIDIF